MLWDEINIPVLAKALFLLILFIWRHGVIACGRFHQRIGHSFPKVREGTLDPLVCSLACPISSHGQETSATRSSTHFSLADKKTQTLKFCGRWINRNLKQLKANTFNHTSSALSGKRMRASQNLFRFYLKSIGWQSGAVYLFSQTLRILSWMQLKFSETLLSTFWNLLLAEASCFFFYYITEINRVQNLSLPSQKALDYFPGPELPYKRDGYQSTRLFSLSAHIGREMRTIHRGGGGDSHTKTEWRGC